jgi:hypothetical protein
MDKEWVNWQTLESRIPLDELPRFHRAFLKLVRPDDTDWDKAFLRQIQGKVQASLKQLKREGQAKQEGDVLLVTRQMVPDAYYKYLDGS